MKIHFIDKKYNNIFIIAKTNCGKNWHEIDESTSELKYVTCNKCLKKIK
jgi:hypothetical protein